MCNFSFNETELLRGKFFKEEKKATVTTSKRNETSLDKQQNVTIPRIGKKMLIEKKKSEIDLVLPGSALAKSDNSAVVEVKFSENRIRINQEKNQNKESKQVIEAFKPQKKLFSGVKR